MIHRMFLDRKTADIIAFSLLSFVEALQVLVIVALIFSFIPIPMPAFAQKLYPMSVYDIHLKREGSFFHFWVLFGLALQGLFIFLNRRRLGEDQLSPKVLPYVCTMAAFLFVQVFAVFKIFLWSNPLWARVLLYASLAAAAAVRIFWPEFRRSITWFSKQLAVRSYPSWAAYSWDAAVVSVMAVLVFFPLGGEVLSRMFSYDKFYHLDVFVMSPAWGYHNGLILNNQVASNYSLILPIIFNSLMDLMGKFDYPQAVSLMIAFCGIYYLLFYCLLRFWLKSVLLASFGVILAVKLQFFHWGVVPLIWIYPSATPLRFFPDVFLIFFLLQFSRDFQWRWLAAAAFSAGVGLVWAIDVGVYMYLTLGLAVICGIYARKGFFKQGVALLLLPFAVALGILWLLYGPSVFHPEFWHNTFEFASIFIAGWGALPMAEVKEQQFFAFCIGFLIPILYTWTFLYSLAMFFIRKSGPHMFILCVSVYGLGLYHYFVNRSAVTSYYAVITPFIFVMLFWGREIISQWPIAWQRGSKLFLCGWAFAALTTGYLFMFYPNVLNLSGNDWSNEKKFYEENFEFSRDAALIDDLTAPGQPVPLISSFETKILMQADRPPFFYIFPLMESEHMEAHQGRGTYILTYAQLEQILGQLREKRPEHIFIEARLFDGPDAEGYENSHEAFKQLMAFVRRNYQYQARGRYLEALKSR
jgi:hypothetical protein